DGMHAFEAARTGCVDVANAAMRNTAAQDDGVQHLLARQVRDKLPGPADKAMVFRPTDRLTNQGGGNVVHDALSRGYGRLVNIVVYRRSLEKTRRGFASAIAATSFDDRPAARSEASGSMSAGGNE